MQQLYLVAEIAGKRVAIEATMVESVVKVGEIVPVPRADQIVAGLFALRSRVLTLIDCQFRVSGKPREASAHELAVIVSVGTCQFGFLVEKVIDVSAPSNGRVQPLPPNSGNWSEFVTGMIDVDEQPVLVLDLERLVSREGLARAA